MSEIFIIPIVAAFVGYITNVIAIKMTFYPLEIVGIDWPKGWLKTVEKYGLPSKFGWQGIIPSKAGKIAGKSVDLLTSSLISVEEQFSRIDPRIVSMEMGPTLTRISREIIEESMEKQIPRIWKLLPEKQKQAIYDSAANEFPATTEAIMVEVKSNIVEFFDLKNMAVSALVRDKSLLNELFLKCGKKEFKFIANSGFFFGGLFGLIQMGIWTIYPAWWILPIGGLIVGFATNWLALKMIFEPIQPIRVGPITIQGLFIKRQKEVAEEYAKIVTNNILTIPKIFDQIMSSENSDRLMDIIRTHIFSGVDKTAGFKRTLVQLTAGSKGYDEVKELACQRFIEALPESIKDIFTYTDEALDIEYTLKDKMSELEPDEFVGVLRPAFQEDEWILILVGTALGFMAGVMQLFFLG